MKRLFFLILILSGCARVATLPPMAAGQVDSWHLTGRIAISTENDNWTANFYWQQLGSAYQLRLNSPLGQGAMLLEGDENGVVMRTADKRTFKAADPDTLIAKIMKIPIPVTNLHAWIRGIPAPKSQPQWYTFDEAGHLLRLRQDGWEIDYGRYVKVQGIDLPKKIFLENNRFKVKFVISRWKL